MPAFTGSLNSIVSGIKINGTDLANWHDILNALTNSWTAFTPSWVASVTNPVLNNGLIQAFYFQDGKLVHFRITITFGSTTTAGSGNYTFGLPVASIEEIGVPVGDCVVQDASVTTNRIAGLCAWLNTTTTIAVTGSTAARMTNASTGIAAITWAAGDQIQIKGTYEAA